MSKTSIYPKTFIFTYGENKKIVIIKTKKAEGEMRLNINKILQQGVKVNVEEVKNARA